MIKPVWRIIGILLAGSMLLTACVDTAPPAITARVQHAPKLVQPLTIEDLYWARGHQQSGTTGGEGEALRDAEMIELGAGLYAVNCAPCHQPNGEGNLNRFPSLNNNALVTAQSPQPLIRTVLYGRGVMPSFAPTLPDEEIAAVLSYIRQAWNNDASPITAAAVRTVQSAPTPAPIAAGEEMGQSSP